MITSLEVQIVRAQGMSPARQLARTVELAAMRRAQRTPAEQIEFEALNLVARGQAPAPLVEPEAGDDGVRSTIAWPREH